MSSIHIRDFWEDGVLYTNINVKIIRNIFTTVFFVIGFAITMLGSHYLKKRNVSQLNRLHDTERVVPVAWMSSWLPLTSVVTYYWKTRMLPGDNYGFLMIFVSIFTVAHPYFVNNLVQTIDIPFETICSFDTGVITTLGVRGLPSSTFLCVTRTNFYPYTDADVLGYWNCTSQPSTILDLTQYSDITNSTTLLNTVETFLTDQDFLYNQTDVTPRVFYNGVSTGFLAWSANETNDSNNTWAVRASLTTGKRHALFKDLVVVSKVRGNQEAFLEHMYNGWTWRTA